MKLEGKEINNLVVVGENQTRVATINQDKIAKLQYLLTNGLYSDGIGSTIVEITNNALDSIVQAGKNPMDNPVYVYIENNPISHKPQLRITDNGLGLDETEFCDVVMNYLTSTKEDDDNAIGAFGIGAKSWCSVSNTATFICRKEGKERTFLCYKGEAFLKYDKIQEVDTTKENGVEFILPIKDYWEKNNYITKAKQKLCYYDNVILTIDGRVVDNKIYRSVDFQWSTLNENDYMHMSLKDVYYTLNFESLGIKNIYVPMCLRFSLQDGIMPTPSRENIIYTDKTKTLILDKLKKVAEWFQKRYNDTVGSYETLMEALPHIGSDDKKVEMEGIGSVTINTLLNFANLEVKDIGIKDTKFYTPKFYKEHIGKFFFEYKRVAYMGSNGSFKKKETSFPLISAHVKDGDNVWLVKQAPTGMVRTYLGEICPADTLFITRHKERKLMPSQGSSDKSYYEILNLHKHPKAEWRERIKEWQHVQKTITDTFEDYTDVEDSEEFKEWLEERKEKQKEARKRGEYSSNYKALNKAKGEITIVKAREYQYGGKAVFDKATCPINKLHKLGKLTVYFNKDEAMSEKSFIYEAMVTFQKIDFVWLNDREIKHVKELKTWKTKEQFMFSKPLKRYVTANLIKDYLALIPEQNANIIYDVFPKFGEMKNTLETYANEHYVHGHHTLFHELKESAIANKQIDPEVYPLLQEFKEAMDMFGFLNYMDNLENYHVSAVERKVIRNMMYIMLKNRKITGRHVDEFLLIPKPRGPVPESEVAYWQPALRSEDGRIVGHEHYYGSTKKLEGFEVWLSKEKLLEKYPKCTPIGYREGEIEHPVIQDPVEPTTNEDVQVATFAYYQPKLNEDGYIEGHEDDWISESDVWKDKANLMETYPNCTAIGYNDGEIEDPSFMDDDDDDNADDDDDDELPDEPDETIEDEEEEEEEEEVIEPEPEVVEEVDEIKLSVLEMVTDRPDVVSHEEDDEENDDWKVKDEEGESLEAEDNPDAALERDREANPEHYHSDEDEPDESDIPSDDEVAMLTKEKDDEEDEFNVEEQVYGEFL